MTRRARGVGRLSRSLLVGGACASVALLLTPWAARSSLSLPVRIEGRPLDLLRPWALWGFAALPLLWAAARRTLVDLPRWQRRLSLAVRASLLAVLLLAAAEPSARVEEDRVAVAALIDVSDSVGDEALEAARARLAALAARSEEPVRLVAYGSRSVPLPPLEPGGSPPSVAALRGAGAGGSASRAAEALRMGLAVLPPGRIGRLWIFSDGLWTGDDPASEAARAEARDVEVHVDGMRGVPPPDAAVLDLQVPSALEPEKPFFVRVRLRATRPVTAMLKLERDGLPAGADAVRRVRLAAGEHEEVFQVRVPVPGVVRLRARLSVEGPDQFEANDTFERVVSVPGRPRVLLVDRRPAHMEAFARALRAAELEVEIRSPKGLPRSVAELRPYALVVLADTPVDGVPSDAVAALERWVRDLGGALLVAGGAQGLGLGGWRGSRLERMLPVRLDTERRRETPTLALALVLDKSGSMSGEKIELAKEAARATLDLLADDDALAVIGFDARPERIVRMRRARNRLTIDRNIGRLRAGGGTNIFPALDLAFQELSAVRARLKHVILLTDGRSREDGLRELARVMRAEGITLSTVGLGSDVARGLLEELAQLGGGRAYFTSDARNVPRIFMKETSTVARSGVIEELVRAQVVHRAAFLRKVPLERAPWLRGYQAVRMRPPPAQLVLQTDLGEPLLARWHLGLGWVAVWSSDLEPRWARDWLRWPPFSRMWAQFVREHRAEEPRRRLPVRVWLEGDALRVRVDALGEDDHFLDGLQGEVRLLSAGRERGGAGERARSRPLRQVAPGRYEARWPRPPLGAHRVQVVLRDERRAVVGRGEAGFVRPYPEEYRRLVPDVDALRALAEAGGGLLDPTAERLLDAGEQRTLRRRSLWRPLVWMALGLFLLDLLLRRVRWGRLPRAPQVT